MARMASIFFGSCSPAPVAGSVVDFSWVKWPQNPPHPYWSSPRTLAFTLLVYPNWPYPRIPLQEANDIWPEGSAGRKERGWV